MTLTDIIALAKAYNNLGWAIQEQLGSLIEGDDTDLNPNALREIDKFLKGVNRVTERNYWDEQTRQNLLDEILLLRGDIDSIIHPEKED